MKQLALLLILLNTTLSCQNTPVTEFSDAALADEFETLSGEKVTFESILEKHKGSKLFIDVWASWCKDCLGGLPGVKQLQKDYPELKYIFLSLDKTKRSWKKGVKRLEITGDHYFMDSGWKGAFGEFLDLDWIPRYLIVDPDGKIQVYKAIKTTDKKLLNAIK